MRICTRDASSKLAYDTSVPVSPRFYNSTTGSYSSLDPDFESAQEHCSSSPYDVPWSFEDASAADNPAAMFSTGSVPMWDGSKLSSNPKYPSGEPCMCIEPLPRRQRSACVSDLPCRLVRPPDHQHGPGILCVQLVDRRGRRPGRCLQPLGRPPRVHVRRGLRVHPALPRAAPLCLRGVRDRHSPGGLLLCAQGLRCSEREDVLG
jgi:hypothetical protein